jgi:hypothetical protein
MPAARCALTFFLSPFSIIGQLESLQDTFAQVVRGSLVTLVTAHFGSRHGPETGAAA